MKASARSRVVIVLLLVLAGGGIAAYLLWPRTAALPEPGTREYDAFLRAFYVGVAAEEVSLTYELATTMLNRAVELVPAEPAAWANRGLLRLRQSQVKDAAADIRQAAQLAPESGDIEMLLGLLAERQGRLSEAVAHLHKAVEKEPDSLVALFALATAMSREGEAGSDEQYQRLMERILKAQPNNLKILAERGVTAARRNDVAAVEETLTRFDKLESVWKRETRKLLEKAHRAVGKGGDIIPALLTLRNLLATEHGFNLDSRAVEPNTDGVGMPIPQFLRLKPPRSTPAPPDRQLTFTVTPWPPEALGINAKRSQWDLIHPMWLTSLKKTELERLEKTNRFGGLKIWPAATFKFGAVLANSRAAIRADNESLAPTFPGDGMVAPSSSGVVAADLNNDFQMDVLLAGSAGLRFWQHGAGGKYSDVTQGTRLPASVLNDNYFGAWAADIEMDSDLDIIAARGSGPPRVLRNNGDGTFKSIDLFGTVISAVDFVWADLDNDGAPDAVFLDAAGKLHIFANERAAQFSPWPLPQDIGQVAAITAADLNADGALDLAALTADSKLLRISAESRRTSWSVVELARFSKPEQFTPGTVRLLSGDLDNNGGTDLIVASRKEARIFLADEKNGFAALEEPVPCHAFAVADLDGDGRLDLLGLSPEGQPVQALNKGKQAYHSRVLWTLANPYTTGDNRLNSFGIGGEIEVRSGMLVQKQPITAPVTHFGLGEQSDMDVVRIVWPNGLSQREFQTPKDRILTAEQRLTGSCPFLFTYDGAGMRFAGDFMWGTPLGMYVNGQNTGDFPQTTEWLKIPGEHLVPRDGYYDVRVHANLWEADYFDQLGLIVVDHPADTEIHVDERFFLTPTPPQLYVTTPAKPVAWAWDHHGEDATDMVRAIDGRYLDRCGRGRFQGITNDHWVEADLGDDAPTEGPVYLIARGWIHPTNSSINVAIAQGDHPRPQPLVLEVPDGKGGWKVGRPALGFPAGKDKTMLIRLDGIDGKGVSRRFRLRTNMEIFWDFLGYARGLDSKLARMERPAPSSAELRHCGILEMTQKDASSPEVPNYDKVTRGYQAWRDLTGFYTRYGDVRELVAKVDDRYVIANAGDEIAFRFPVPAAPPPGWKRDFIWECDGWTRDGDLNTRHGNTVLPLPAHGVKMSDAPPGRLADDPVYRRFPEDWLRFHTRYITADAFERGLRTFRLR